MIISADIALWDMVLVGIRAVWYDYNLISRYVISYPNNDTNPDIDFFVNPMTLILCIIKVVSASLEKSNTII